MYLTKKAQSSPVEEVQQVAVASPKGFLMPVVAQQGRNSHRTSCFAEVEENPDAAAVQEPDSEEAFGPSAFDP